MYGKLFVHYISANKLSSIFWGYIFVSVMLKTISIVDITIPCPIKSCFGISCLGCGLTTATVFLVRLDFVNAWHANPLVFAIVPFLTFFFVRHCLQFVRTERVKNTSNCNL